MPWDARKSGGKAGWLAPLLSLALAAAAMAGGALVGPTRPTTALPAYPEVAQWLAEPSRPPAPDADPGAVATFFATHPAALGVDLAHRYPRVVGALDGAPPALREVANADLAGRPDLLLYDPRGDGRIAAVLGDLRRADRIAVLIPGMNTTLANYTTGLGHVLRRSPQWQARQLWEAARARQPGARLAVIAWLGYDPPDALGPAAAREDRAAAGASALLRFVAGLGAPSARAPASC